MPFPGWYDIIFDFSHEHQTSLNFKDAPVLNLIGDKECYYTPPCAIVETHYMQKFYPTAQHVSFGLDITQIPFTENPTGGYLLFMALLHPYKGYQIAFEIGKMLGRKVIFAGPQLMELNLPNYIGPIYEDAKKYDLLGNADALLCPYVNDAAPRIPLEAAACGCPTICLLGDGTEEHVANGVSGFHCLNKWEMAEMVARLSIISRAKARKWVHDAHSLDSTIQVHEMMLKQILEGEKW